MAEKRSFSDDWSRLTDEEVDKNIRYMLDYYKYKEYEIVRKDKNTISVGDICLSKAKFQKQDMFCVNQKFYPRGDIYNLLDRLYDACAREIDYRKAFAKFQKRQDKRERRFYWWQNKKTAVIFYGVTVLIMSALFGFAVREQKKLEEIDNKVKEYEKSLPNYKEYQQTQQKIANYRDSLEHAGR